MTNVALERKANGQGKWDQAVGRMHSSGWEPRDYGLWDSEEPGEVKIYATQNSQRIKKKEKASGLSQSLSIQEPDKVFLNTRRTEGQWMGHV